MTSANTKHEVLGKVNSPASLKSPANLLMWPYL